MPPTGAAGHLTDCTPVHDGAGGHQVFRGPSRASVKGAARQIPHEREKWMAISDKFTAADVLLDVNAGSKRGLLETLAEEASGRLGRPSQEILEALQARERLGSTALGKGVALPHAELRDGGRPIVLFARLRRPIDFDARDDEPVDIVFLVLWPNGTGKGLLPAMSEICRSLREPQMLRRLRLASTPDEVISLVHQLAAPGPNPEPPEEES